MMFDQFVQGLISALTLRNLLMALLGASIGTFTGVLPGFGPAAAIALLIPVTFTLPPETAVIVMAGVYFGAMYGGSTTSILLRLPGEAASVVTILDGHELAKRGQGGKALSVAAIGSFVGNGIAILGVAVAAPKLAQVALAFGPPEYFSVLVLGLLMSTQFFGRSVLKGVQMLLLGLLMGTVGLDPVSGYARLTFGHPGLLGGFEFVAVAMGLFGLADMLGAVVSGRPGDAAAPPPVTPRIGDLLLSRNDLRRSAGPIVRGTLIGFPLGIIPGLGPVVASFVSYALEKRLSKNPDRFGTGMIEGVAAPETANNAAAASTFVPLFSLGIPSTAVAAVMLGALVIHGLRPGPLLLSNNPQFFWTVVGGMFVANGLLLILNLPMIPLWASVIRIPKHILFPIVLMSMMIGAYSLNGSSFDVIVMVLAGAAGYWLQRKGYSAVPLVVGLVLSPMLELNFRQSLAISKGNPAIFITSPVAACALSLAALLLAWPLLHEMGRRLRGKRGKPQGD